MYILYFFLHLFIGFINFPPDNMEFSAWRKQKLSCHWFEFFGLPDSPLHLNQLQPRQPIFWGISLSPSLSLSLSLHQFKPRKPIFWGISLSVSLSLSLSLSLSAPARETNFLRYLSLCLSLSVSLSVCLSLSLSLSQCFPLICGVDFYVCGCFPTPSFCHILE